MTNIVGGSASGWGARLAVEVAADGRRTRVRYAEHCGPLRIQRPFYPEGDAPAHLYLLHPPGGLVGGDRLEVDLRVRTRAELLVTTPAAQKIYRTLQVASSQRVTLRVEADAALEWLPAETIVFDGARSRLSTHVELEPSAVFMGWDIGCLGRPASGLPFRTGSLQQQFEIRVGEQLLVNERSLVRGGSEVLSEAFGYAGFTSYGTLYCVPRSRNGLGDVVDGVRDELARACGAPTSAQRRIAVTSIDGVIVVRVLATTIETARQPLVAAWARLRPTLVGRAAVAPRIWAT